MSGSSFVALALSVMALLLAPRSATAQTLRPQAIHVLTIDSDDADEQAEALTSALRAHVRETQGWALLETTQPLSMLTAAFKCPQRPDAGCLERIGDKLKTDQFIWGVMSKAPGHQVAAEVHVWSRGKPDQVTRETYSDNLKEASDDALKRIATSIFVKLVGGANVPGTLLLHVSADTGSVLVDGMSKGNLEHGTLTLSLPAGSHTVEIQATGFPSRKRDVTIQPGLTLQLEIDLRAEETPPAVVAPSKPLPWRRIAGGSALVAGAVLIGVGVGFGVSWLGDVSTINSDTSNDYGYGTAKNPVNTKNGGTVTTNGSTKISNPCTYSQANGLTTNTFAPASELNGGCSAINSAHSAVTGEVTTFVIGGVLAATGIYLIVTDHSSSDASTAPPADKTALRSLELKPSVDFQGASMAVVGRF
jgi:hypothetical protein